MNIVEHLVTLTPQDIEQEVNLTEFPKFTKNNNMLHDLNCRPGIEHYKLLCYISKLYNNEILIELGSWIGAGALSLSYNPNNYVITYDVVEYLELLMLPKNLERRLGDYKKSSDILKSPFIFVDLLHDGSLEMEVYNYLTVNKFKGITMWDDIYLNNDMDMFWSSVRHKKYDISYLGHSTGTGIIVFE